MTHQLLEVNELRVRLAQELLLILLLPKRRERPALVPSCERIARNRMLVGQADLEALLVLFQLVPLGLQAGPGAKGPSVDVKGTFGADRGALEDGLVMARYLAAGLIAAHAAYGTQRYLMGRDARVTTAAHRGSGVQITRALAVIIVLVVAIVNADSVT